MAIASELTVLIEAQGAQAVIGDLQSVENAQKRVVAATQQTGQQTGLAENALVKFGKGWQTTMGQIMTAAIPVTVAITGVKKLLDLSREGAQLDLIASRFENLTARMGVDNLRAVNDLKNATHGLVSEYDLMANASQIMSLELAKTYEDTIRLTSVSGQLGWNMNEVVLTIANLSERRLDQLGLSVDTVREKFEALKDQGFGKEEAWFESVVSSGEELIGVLGSVATTNAGMWQQMKASEKEFFDNLKTDAGELLSWWPEFWNGIFGAENTAHKYYDLIDEARSLGIDTVKYLQENPNLYANNLDFGGASGQAAVRTLTNLIIDYKAARQAALQLEIPDVQSLLSGDVYGPDTQFSKLPGHLTALNYELERLSEQETPAARTLKTITTEMGALEEELEGANFTLDVAVRTFTESIGSQLYQGLRDTWLTGDQLLERIKLIDQAFGTNYVLEYTMELDIDDLLTTLINNPEKFLQDAQLFLDYFTPLQTSVQTAMGEVEMLQQALDDLAKEYDIYVKVRVSGLPDLGDGLDPDRFKNSFTDTGGYGLIGDALGGPVYPGVPTIVGERGPEPFIPSTYGHIMTNADWVALGGSGSSSTEIDYKRLAKAFTDGLIGAMEEGRLGSTVYVDASSGEQQTAFELLRSYGGNYR